MVKKETLAQRVKEAYPKLSAIAANLNVASDKLSASIANLDIALKELKLGISSWVRFSERDPGDPMLYYLEEVGYAKLGGKWGLAIRTRSGHEAMPEDEKLEAWPFNEAPRGLRVHAVLQIPALLEELIKDANEIIKTVDERVEVVDLLTAAINDIQAGSKKTNIGQIMQPGTYGKDLLRAMVKADKDPGPIPMPPSVTSSQDEPAPTQIPPAMRTRK